eukprot:scaffold232321_cov33-Tisochrysis_lutea.AAC.1
MLRDQKRPVSQVGRHAPRLLAPVARAGGRNHQLSARPKGVGIRWVGRIAEFGVGEARFDAECLHACEHAGHCQLRRAHRAEKGGREGARERRGVEG